MGHYSLTVMPPGGRGCGERKEGGLYMCVGLSPYGSPWYEFLIDPVTPFQGDRFQGVQPAPAELVPGEFRRDDIVVFMDMIGAEHYATVPAYIEEVRRFGRSRYVPENFDWSRCAGKSVFVIDLHWRAGASWITRRGRRPKTSIETVKVGGVTLPALDFWPCQVKSPEHYPDCIFHLVWPCQVKSPEHYPDCIFHLWPLAGLDDPEACAFTAPWGLWHPTNVIASNRADLAAILAAYPPVEFYPAAFALWEIKHVEAVGYVPDTCNVAEAGLPVEVVEE